MIFCDFCDFTLMFVSGTGPPLHPKNKRGEHKSNWKGIGEAIRQAKYYYLPNISQNPIEKAIKDPIAQKVLPLFSETVENMGD